MFININDKISIFSGYFDIETCEAYPDKIWVFGDNETRRGKGGQACIRDCENSIGLRTKAAPHSGDSAFWSDSTYDQNCRKIDEDIETIKRTSTIGNMQIVLSSNGYGTGLSELPQRAPKTFEYLVDQLNKLCEPEYDVFSYDGTCYIAT